MRRSEATCPTPRRCKRYEYGRRTMRLGAILQPLRLAKEPNEANRFGWVVEIDPSTRPRRRSSAPRSGRFKHEGANVIVAPTAGSVVYTRRRRAVRLPLQVRLAPARYDPAQPGRQYRTSSTAARSRWRGSRPTAREWLPLVHGQGPLTAANGFPSQADVVINARARAICWRDADGPARGRRGRSDDRQGLRRAHQERRAQARAGRRRQSAGGEQVRPDPGVRRPGRRARWPAPPDRFAWDLFISRRRSGQSREQAKYHKDVSADGWIVNPGQHHLRPAGKDVDRSRRGGRFRPRRRPLRRTTPSGPAGR